MRSLILTFDRLILTFDRFFTATVTVLHQPVHRAESENDAGINEERTVFRLLHVDDDELTNDRQHRDDNDDSDLNYALLSFDDLHDRVVELERDQDRYDHAEQRYKSCVLEQFG